jgi:hypothetical protein
VDGRSDGLPGTAIPVPLARSAEPDSDADRAGTRPRGWSWKRDAGGPLLIYAATRLVQLIILNWMTPPGGPSIKSKLLSWDSGWFLNVAQNGYPKG